MVIIMKKKILLIMIFGVWLATAGCAGKQGPMGPEGPGNQSIHNVNITPAASSASYDIAASEVVANPGSGDNSTVTCYVMLSTAPGVEVAIPTTLTEADNTTTDYFYEVRTGVVTLGWRNSGSTVPKIAQFVVMVINKQ
jgi:hypothetical protein